MSAIAPPSTLPRVLVVDDELGPRESLRMLLKPAYHIQTAENGRAALDALEWFRPDVVIMDIKMPEIDGLELLQRVKTADRTIEVIMITAYASLETVKHALTNGAFEYLIKPFARQDLEAVVRRALLRRQAGGRRAVPPGHPALDPARDLPHDRRRARSPRAGHGRLGTAPGGAGLRPRDGHVQDAGACGGRGPAGGHLHDPRCAGVARRARRGQPRLRARDRPAGARAPRDALGVPGDRAAQLAPLRRDRGHQAVAREAHRLGG